MKFNTALKLLVATEALYAMNSRFGVRAQSVVVDRTLENNGDHGGRGDGSSSKPVLLTIWLRMQLYRTSYSKLIVAVV